jgi:hypothetical protein
MKANRPFYWIILSLFVIFLLSCNLIGPQTSPVQPEPTTLDGSPTEPENTVTVQPTASMETPTETEALATEAVGGVTATKPGPSCTIQQDLNLRFGPGTAYRPPVMALPAKSTVTPRGFVSQGIPGGSWVFVHDPATQKDGWVSAGSQFVSCDIDLATLPAVAFGTPPPFFPATVQTSPGPGQGFCKDQGSSKYSCVLTFSDEYLFQVRIFRNGVEINQNNGVEPVSFIVTKNGKTVYSTVESVAAYCIFGGNGPCNDWTFEGGTLKWKAGGAPVESGEYKMAIDVTVKGESSHWESFFTLNVP